MATPSPDPSTGRPPGLAGALANALRAACPRCGRRGIFRSWGQLVDHCPRCGLRFEREEGYWVGAMILNIGGAQLLFFAVFLGGLALTWPDVPWNWLIVLGLTVMIGFPILFYPLSKTLWLAADLVVRGRRSDWTDGDPLEGR